MARRRQCLHRVTVLSRHEDVTTLAIEGFELMAPAANWKNARQPNEIYPHERALATNRLHRLIKMMLRNTTVIRRAFSRHTYEAEVFEG